MIDTTNTHTHTYLPINTPVYMATRMLSTINRFVIVLMENSMYLQTHTIEIRLRAFKGIRTFSISRFVFFSFSLFPLLSMK